MYMEAAGGITLFAAALLGLFFANSPLESHYASLRETQFSVALGHFSLEKPLLLWINDGLMAIFFLLVGLELKRELVEGHLSSFKRAIFPAIAAIGGMLVPAGIYFAMNYHDAKAIPGWAIPTATDIAFAMGIIALLGKRVPSALKVFLLSVAIFDDIGAIIIIAIFYTPHLSFTAMVVAAIFIAALFLINRMGVRRLAPYFVLGVPLWVAVLESGIHATLTGVILALMIPLKKRSSTSTDTLPDEEAPLHRLIHDLHPWVAFGILPLFAFVNTGISFADMHYASFWHHVPLGIMLGLFIGKPLGILGFTWVAVKLRIARLGKGLQWRQVYGISIICGTGFTMSLFIASLAAGQGGMEYVGLDRLGILGGSLISGVVGSLYLKRVCPTKRR